MRKIQTGTTYYRPDTPNYSPCDLSDIHDALEAINENLILILKELGVDDE